MYSYKNLINYWIKILLRVDVMAKKIKITRKELLKEPDQFLSSTDKAMLFFKQNRSSVIGGVIGVILLGLSFLGYQNYEKSETMKFESLYFKMEKIRLSCSHALIKYLIAQKIHCKMNIQNPYNPIIHFINI